MKNKLIFSGFRNILEEDTRRKRRNLIRGLCLWTLLTAAISATFLLGCGQTGDTVYTIADSAHGPSESAASEDGREETERPDGSSAEEEAWNADSAEEEARNEEAADAVNPDDKASASESSEAAEGSGSQSPPQIVIYICGAVETPGIYSLPDGSRVYQAVEAAGGLTEAADPRYLNQAQRLLDGEQITVYTTEETEKLGLGPGSGPLTEDGNLPGSLNASESPGGTAGSAANRGNAAKVNLNTADRDTLMTLPGIGEAKADAILSYRDANGGFSSIEDIQNIPGIKEKAFEKIKDLITV